MLVLALESSTSAAKAMLYDSEQGVIATESMRYDPSFCKDGVSGTDEVFRMTMEMGRKVAAGKQIAAIALGCIWHSVAICDGDMRPAGGTYAWNYMAPSDMCREARADEELVKKLYHQTGCMPHVIYPRQALRYLRQNGLDLSDKLLPSQGAYTFYKLTGEFMETLNVLCGTGVINVNNGNYDSFAMDYAGIRKDQLGSICHYSDVRPLNTFGAELLGLDVGIPVVPAHADGALNQIANCAAVIGRMTLSVGTSGAIRLTTTRPVLPEGRQLWSYYGVADWVSGAATNGACNCVDWYQGSFLGGKMSFAELDEGEDASGRMPVFMPFLFGERNPGWRDDRLGGFQDVRSEHTAREMYRAVQAGILFNLYQCYEVLAREEGVPVEIYASGGLLNSKRWTQMMADIFGTPIRCVQNLNASTMGAIVLALHAAGAMEDIRAYTGDIEGAVEIYPDSKRAAFYKDWYQRYLEHYNLSAGR